jgi:hypothetical protein
MSGGTKELADKWFDAADDIADPAMPGGHMRIDNVWDAAARPILRRGMIFGGHSNVTDMEHCSYTAVRSAANFVSRPESTPTIPRASAAAISASQ